MTRTGTRAARARGRDLRSGALLPTPTGGRRRPAGAGSGALLTAALLSGLATVAGCGPGVTDVTEGAGPVAATTPYDGPLTAPGDSDEPSASKRGGAAALALECDGTPSNGGGGDYGDGLETVQDDAVAAVSTWMEQEGSLMGLPATGYRVEREDGDRTLLSYDVEGRSKVAVVVADGIRDWEGDTGWGVESWAQCDPAEWPAAVAEELGHQIWHRPDGTRVPTSTVSSSAGPEHCDWQDITFLTLGSPGRRQRQFLADEKGELAELLRGEYAADVPLPRDATRVGYRRDGRELWLAADGSAAYLVEVQGSAAPEPGASAQRWPAAREPIGCA